MNVLHHLNIHSIIEESLALSDDLAHNLPEDLAQRAHRFTLLKAASLEELQLFKLSGKSSAEQLSRLKENVDSRILTCVNIHEKTFLKDLNAVISRAILMRKENEDITHINLPCLKQESGYLSNRDLAMFNEIDLITARTKHQEHPKLILAENGFKDGLKLAFELTRRFFQINKAIFLKARYLLKKLHKIHQRKLRKNAQAVMAEKPTQPPTDSH
ncbi:MAG: hypothetical protein JSS07_04645 [Proteobacteria bacterium]|nr:hypothetical protein [Pseudomonadota bacterium]